MGKQFSKFIEGLLSDSCFDGIFETDKVNINISESNTKIQSESIELCQKCEKKEEFQIKFEISSELELSNEIIEAFIESEEKELKAFAENCGYELV